MSNENKQTNKKKSKATKVTCHLQTAFLRPGTSLVLNIVVVSVSFL
jgi:hypothetical protein